MKKILSIALVVITLLAIASCGNKVYDTVTTFDYAIVSFPDGRSEKIEIEAWADFVDGDQIQIYTKDGTVFLFHTEDCVLVKEGK